MISYKKHRKEYTSCPECGEKNCLVIEPAYPGVDVSSVLENLGIKSVDCFYIEFDCGHYFYAVRKTNLIITHRKAIGKNQTSCVELNRYFGSFNTEDYPWVERATFRDIFKDAP